MKIGKHLLCNISKYKQADKKYYNLRFIINFEENYIQN